MELQRLSAAFNVDAFALRDVYESVCGEDDVKRYAQSLSAFSSGFTAAASDMRDVYGRFLNGGSRCPEGSPERIRRHLIDEFGALGLEFQKIASEVYEIGESREALFYASAQMKRLSGELKEKAYHDLSSFDERNRHWLQHMSLERLARMLRDPHQRKVAVGLLHFIHWNESGRPEYPQFFYALAAEDELWSAKKSQGFVRADNSAAVDLMHLLFNPVLPKGLQLRRSLPGFQILRALSGMLSIGVLNLVRGLLYVGEALKWRAPEFTDIERTGILRFWLHVVSELLLDDRFSNVRHAFFERVLDMEERYPNVADELTDGLVNYLNEKGWLGNRGHGSGGTSGKPPPVPPGSLPPASSTPTGNFSAAALLQNALINGFVMSGETSQASAFAAYTNSTDGLLPQLFGNAHGYYAPWIGAELAICGAAMTSTFAGTAVMPFAATGL